MKNPIRRQARCNRASVLLLIAGSLLSAAAGCSTLGERGKQLVPTNHTIRTGPFLISSDFELKDDSPVIRCLKDLETEVVRTLDLEPSKNDATIEVYILNNRDSFAHFLKFYYPRLPSRRAFFMAQGESRVVYTFASPKLEEDLRHEAAHALLNLRFGDLPLWLDEGLAEYFEVLAPADAGSQDHLDKLPADLAENWKPDLNRLENLADIRQMTPGDYRESWAWVYSFLAEPGSKKAILLGFLRDAPERRAQSSLSARLKADGAATDGAALAAYMSALRDQRKSGAATAPNRVVRFQDRPLDGSKARAQAATAKAEVEPRGLKGFARRIGSLLGL